MSGAICKTAPLLVLILSGCASTGDVLNKDIDEILRTSQPPSEVADCLERSNNTRAIELPDGARVLAFRNGYGGVIKTFSIYPDGTGSRIEVRHSFINVPGYRWKRCVGLSGKE